MEVARTTDPVRFAYLQSALNDAGIANMAFDSAAGGLWPGAFPRRLMVDDRDAWRARHVLKDAEAAIEAAGPPLGGDD